MHDSPATWSVEIAHGRKVVLTRENVEVALRVGKKCHASKAGLLGTMSHMYVAIVVGTPHIQGVLVAGGALQSEGSGESFHNVKVWRSESHECHVANVDGHGSTPKPR
jgi:hypothetical protein